MRRVAITGLGTICGLGHNVDAVWDNVCAGRSGMGAITRFDTSDHKVKIAAEIKDFDPSQVMDRREARRLDDFAIYAFAAAQEAIADAGFEKDHFEDHYPLERIGCLVGSGIGGLRELEEQARACFERSPSKVSPFFIPKLMGNAASGNLSIHYGFKGVNYATMSACASAGHALGLAFRHIQMGDADMMVAGGSEATIRPTAVAGFANMKALSTRDCPPEEASCPFDTRRDGFVMGEGSGILILEELESAKKRGAKIYAEMIGFGFTADAGGITAPSEDGSAPSSAMLQAISGYNPDQVDYINAHGTSTPLGDVSETVSIKRAFGDHARKLCISSTKSMAGHLLGGSGGLETAMAVKSVYHRVIHPTANLQEPDPECDLDYVPGEAQERAVDIALSNSFGFGGHNVCLAVRRFEG